jgi:hypothetical protein
MPLHQFDAQSTTILSTQYKNTLFNQPLDKPGFKNLPEKST